jgi:RimJ/RimL family protein N-acetyltransferase
MKDLHGERVRLTALDSERDAEALARWSTDSEYWRLRYPFPAQPRTAAEMRAELDRQAEDRDTDVFEFGIRTLADDRLIGTIALFGVDAVNGDAEVGIGIGEREYWGRGYGTDALRVLLRFAFDELNLHRVSLSALGANPRAVRSYEKAGFVREGALRGQNHYGGQRFDEVCMGLLREAWRRQAGVT